MKVLSIQKKQGGWSFAEVSKEKGHIQIHLLRTFSDSADEEEIRAALSLDTKEKLQISSSLTTKESFYRTLSLPIVKRKQISKVLPFEIEAMLPYPSEEAIVQYQYETTDQTFVSLASVRKEQLRKYVEEVKKSGFEPDWVGVAPWSLFLFCQQYCSNAPHLLVLYTGEKESTLLTIVEGRLLTSVFIPYGINSEEIKENYYLRALQFCLEKDKEKKINHYLLLGESLDEEFFVKNLPQSFQEYSLKSTFDTKTLAYFALEIGSALNVLSDDTLQFRRGEDLSPKHKKQIRRKIQALALSSLFLPFFLFAVTKGVLFKQQRQISHSLNEMIQSTKAPITSAPLHFFATQKSLEGQEISLEKLRSHLDKKNPLAPFHRLPRAVTQLLHAVASHPLLERNARLVSFHYQLIQYPDLEKPNQETKIKLDCTFTGENPALFKEFFQQIKEKGDPLLHAKKDSTYTRESENHTFSFVLKDKSS